MLVRGTRSLRGEDARRLVNLLESLAGCAEHFGYQEFIPSSLAPKELFVGQVGDSRMYELTDRGGRELVLIPEVTAVARRQYRDVWSKEVPDPVRIYYRTRCYRYDRPQAGRWREFWQFGVEHFGKGGVQEVKGLLEACLDAANVVDYVWKEPVERGLRYYTKLGFEVELPMLGAAKQIAGGGAYEEGVGWALGPERILMAEEAIP